jgi:hypothetical protein
MKGPLSVDAFRRSLIAAVKRQADLGLAPSPIHHLKTGKSSRTVRRGNSVRPASHRCRGGEILGPKLLIVTVRASLREKGLFLGANTGVGGPRKRIPPTYPLSRGDARGLSGIVPFEAGSTFCSD